MNKGIDHLNWELERLPEIEKELVEHDLVVVTKKDVDKELVADCFGSYVRMRCPHCREMNWLYLGRIDDLSAMDREAMECWSCDKSSWLSENIKDDYGYESLYEAYIEKGTKAP